MHGCNNNTATGCQLSGPRPATTTQLPLSHTSMCADAGEHLMQQFQVVVCTLCQAQQTQVSISDMCCDRPAKKMNGCAVGSMHKTGHDRTQQNRTHMYKREHARGRWRDRVAFVLGHRSLTWCLQNDATLREHKIKRLLRQHQRKTQSATGCHMCVCLCVHMVEHATASPNSPKQCIRYCARTTVVALCFACRRNVYTQTQHQRVVVCLRTPINRTEPCPEQNSHTAACQQLTPRHVTAFVTTVNRIASVAGVI